MSHSRIGVPGACQRLGGRLYATSAHVDGVSSEVLRHLTFCCAVQICHEFERFSVYLPNIKVGNFFGGLPIKNQRDLLKSNCPHIVVGTPGRLKQVGPEPDVF